MAKNQDHKEVERIIAEKKERLKELACINRTTQILKEGKSIDETLLRIVQILPDAWQYPERTVARIIYEKQEFRSKNFSKTSWCQRQEFKTVGGKTGCIEIYYLQKFRDYDEGPFLLEERE